MSFSVAAAVLADVGVLADLAVGRAPQHAVVLHRHYQQRAVRHPAEAGRLLLDRHDLFGRARRVYRQHEVAVEVGHPPAAVVPARPLEEGPAFQQRLELSLRHRRDPT